MNQFVKTHKRKLILGAIIALLYIGLKALNVAPKQMVEPASGREAEASVITEKRASVIHYGSWAPTEVRTVLGQVVSDSDIAVKAELSGTIAQVGASVGDKVTAGQILARFKTAGDPSAINYQSALSNLETTKLSGQNSIRSAEISVENARKSLAQTQAQQDQNYNQAYDALRLEAQAVMTTITTALDTIDRNVQYTSKYRYNQDFSYAQIGNSDSIRRQNIKNTANQITQRASQLRSLSATASASQILQDSTSRLQVLTSLQVVYDDLEILIERTSINTRISQTQVASYLATVEGVHAALDAKVGTYQAAIERAKGAREQSRLAVLGAQNALESAQAGLALAKSQAEAQTVGAQNQVNIASASTADLVVRAPISGTITDKSVRVGDLVNPGTVLFNIVNESQVKKVVAFLNQDERRQAQTAKAIEVEIDGKIVPVTNRFLSSQIDGQTQKSLAEFTIPAGATLVGNLATVRIPIGSVNSNGDSNLIPFSSVSFEPDGPEVLVLNEDQIAERKKIVVDRVVVSNVEVVSGLASGEAVVEYYKRVLPGERVVDENQAVVSTAATVAATDVTLETVKDGAETGNLKLETTNE